MPKFTGKVMKGKSSVYKAVEGEYEIDEWEAGNPWKGFFEVKSGEVPFIEDDGEIFMDDGKHGPMTITRVRLGTDIVEFRGEGQLKESKESSFS
ncbi:MAG: hypothetical protein R3F19_15530 [Verrucomicrobiales bacterium]|nr:hypothetical protein [Verrucomicrobiae bacterium]